jgi:hypothetical protein
MTRTKNLTLEIANQWDGNASLREYTSIDSDAATVLANRDDADLDLLGLTVLSLPVAKALSSQKNGSLNIDSLTSLEDHIAEEFSKYHGFLGLAGLTSLSVAGARALSKSVQFLDLSGLTSVSTPVAEALSQCAGRVQLQGITSLTHPGLASKLAEVDDELHIPRLTELSEEAAIALSKTTARLLLPGLKSIPSFDLAWKLFLQEKDSDPLSSLTALSAPQAAIISTYKGDVYLDRVPTLSDVVAETLSQHHGVLGLRALASLSETAVESLSKHANGILILPPALSTKVASNFTRRYIGCNASSLKPSPNGTVNAFELKHGKFYDCKVDSETTEAEDCTILQLAMDATTNRRFVLFGAKRIYTKDPDFVQKLIDLDFYFLFTQEYDSPEWNTSIMQMFLDENGVMLRDEHNDGCLYDFKETDAIGFKSAPRTH